MGPLVQYLLHTLHYCCGLFNLVKLISCNCAGIINHRYIMLHPAPLFLPCVPFSLQDVYGVMRSLEGLDMSTDLMSSTQMGPWYLAMKELVQRQSGRLM